MSRTHKAFGRFGYFLTKLETGSPFVEITLGDWIFTDLKSGGPLLTEDLMTDGEIDRRISELKDDLDRAGASAKRALTHGAKAPKA